MILQDMERQDNIQNLEKRAKRRRPLRRLFLLFLLVAIPAAVVTHRYLGRMCPAPWKEPVFYVILPCLLLLLFILITFCSCLLRYFRAISLQKVMTLGPVTGIKLLLRGAGFLLVLCLSAVALEKCLFHFYFLSPARDLSLEKLTVQRPVHVLEARRGLQLGFQEQVTLPLILDGTERVFLSYLVSGGSTPFPVRCTVTRDVAGIREEEVLSRLMVSRTGKEAGEDAWQEFELLQTGGQKGSMVLRFSTDLCPGLLNRLLNLDRLLYYALSLKADTPPLTFCLHWSPLVADNTPEPRPVNILLFDIDTLRADSLGCYGFPEDISPAIDRIARDSILFQNVYSQATWTLPSTISLLSSLYVDTHGIFDQHQRIPEWPFLSLADLLRQAGYLTLGAVDGGFVSAEYGFATGFHRYSERRDSEKPSKNSFYLALEMIHRFQAQPFFLFLQTYMVHEYFHLTPEYTKGTLLPPPEVLGKKSYARYILDYYAGRQKETLSQEDFIFLNDLYRQGIRSTDFYFNRFISQLKSLDLYDNTWIIMTSDHGEGFGEYHNRQAFRSLMHGRPPYEDQARIPLIMKFPKRWNIPGGRVVTRKVNSVDILPTILDYLGLPEEGQMQGRSLKPLIEGAALEWQSPTLTGDPICGFAYVGEEGYKLLKMPALGETPPNFELYNLARDAGENSSLSKEKDKFDALRGTMEKLQARAGKKLGKRKAVKSEEISPGLQKRLKELGYIQ